MTKLKVKEIVLEEPIEGTEPWPEPEKPEVPEVVVEADSDDETGTEDDAPTTVEWDLSKKDEDDEDQAKLF